MTIRFNQILNHFLGMAGRGFLKSRLANITSKKQSTPEESLKLATQPISHTDVPNVLISGISSQALLPTNQEIVRGRRVNIEIFNSSRNK